MIVTRGYGSNLLILRGFGSFGRDVPDSGEIPGYYVDWLIELLRMQIADQKYKTVQVVREDTGVVSNGQANEMYYTSNLPVASGTDTYMRIGRWVYQEVDSVQAALGLRAYFFNAGLGLFYIPEGAIYGEDQSRVRIGYSWLEEQACKFTDTVLRYYIQDAIVMVNSDYHDFSYTTTEVDNIASYVYVKYAVYLIKKQMEAEGFDNRIYIRDLNVAINTSKGLGELAKSSQILMEEIDVIITKLRTKEQVVAPEILDTYSTYTKDSEDDNDVQWKAEYQY